MVVYLFIKQVFKATSVENISCKSAIAVLLSLDVCPIIVNMVVGVNRPGTASAVLVMELDTLEQHVILVSMCVCVASCVYSCLFYSFFVSLCSRPWNNTLGRSALPVCVCLI